MYIYTYVYAYMYICMYACIYGIYILYKAYVLYIQEAHGDDQRPASPSTNTLLDTSLSCPTKMTDNLKPWLCLLSVSPFTKEKL